MAVRNLDPAESRSIVLIASATLASGGKPRALVSFLGEWSLHAALLDLGDRQLHSHG